MRSASIDYLIESLSKLPGIGERSATRLAFYLLRSPADYRQKLAQSITGLDRIRLCSHCKTVTENDPCSLCTSRVRQHDKICVLEKPADIYAIERLQTYHGVYHILHGLLSPLEGITPDDLTIAALLQRIQSESPVEIILGLNPTIEGDATAQYLSRKIQSLGLQTPPRVTRLASGLPMGGQLEYADQITLGKAFEARTDVR